MKAKVAFSIVFLSLFVINIFASQQVPILVSPGSDAGIAMVGQVCPTFSWTAVEGSTAYKVAIFEAIENMPLTYEEMAASAYPVLAREIMGAATSWTPSSNECLSDRVAYVWFDQALDAYGVGTWSVGKPFQVNVASQFSAIEASLSEHMERTG